MNPAASAFESARAAVLAAEAANMSASTTARRYRAMFAAEDALRASVGGWAR